MPNDPSGKLRFDADTRAILDEVKDRLIAAGLVDPRDDAATQEARVLHSVIIASTLLPLHMRILVMLVRPWRVLRARRALRPMRATIRARLALPDPSKPWIEDHEAVSLLLHGI